MFTSVTGLLLLTAWTVQGTVNPVNSSATTIFSGRPRDCQDLIHQGNTYIGYYVIYPEQPSKASLIYCSQDDGMEPLPSDRINGDVPRNCYDLLQDGNTESRVYAIYPYLEHPTTPVLVLCDQQTDGGGWSVIQKRFDGSEDFYRTFSEYSIGFGSTAAEHYLGNEIIAAITVQNTNELRVELEAWNGETAYAHYKVFHVETNVDSWSRYKLGVFFYDGTAGDALGYNNGQNFSTYDSDSDAISVNCAEECHSGWWHRACTSSNLNGRYYFDDTDSLDSMCWYGFRGYHSLKASTMLIRPASASTTQGCRST